MTSIIFTITLNSLSRDCFLCGKALFNGAPADI